MARTARVACSAATIRILPLSLSVSSSEEGCRLFLRVPLPDLSAAQHRDRVDRARKVSSRHCTYCQAATDAS